MDYLGAFRFVLAVTVAAFHIWTQLFPDAGRHAVMGFFVISGFLITKIAKEIYNDRPIEFLINRALRIYPAYWVSLIFTLLCALLFPVTSKDVFWLIIPFPEKLSEWLTNITIFEILSNKRAITQTWSLHLEIILYLVIGLATFRSLGLTIIGFLISFGWALYGITHISEFAFYFNTTGIAFVFFAGSLAYFISTRIVLPLPFLWGGLLCYMMTMYVIPHRFNVSEYATPVPHLFLLISVIAVVFILLSLPSTKILSQRTKKVSYLLGKLSYPVFLLHKVGAIPIVAMFGENRSFAFVGGMMITLLISYGIVKLESFIEILRQTIRSGKLRL